MRQGCKGEEGKQRAREGGEGAHDEVGGRSIEIDDEVSEEASMGL